MTFEGTPSPNERLSTKAKDFFESLPGAEQVAVDALLDRVLENPAVDGQTIFDLSVPPAMWRVLVDADFTVYFRVITYIDPPPRRVVVQIDAIRRTLRTVREMLQYPFP